MTMVEPMNYMESGGTSEFLKMPTEDLLKDLPPEL